MRGRGIEPAPRRCLPWSLTTGPGARVCWICEARPFGVDLTGVSEPDEQVQLLNLKNTDGEPTATATVTINGRRYAHVRMQGRVGSAEGRSPRLKGKQRLGGEVRTTATDRGGSGEGELVGGVLRIPLPVPGAWRKQKVRWSRSSTRACSTEITATT